MLRAIHPTTVKYSLANPLTNPLTNPLANPLANPQGNPLANPQGKSEPALVIDLDLLTGFELELELNKAQKQLQDIKTQVAQLDSVLYNLRKQKSQQKSKQTSKRRSKQKSKQKSRRKREIQFRDCVVKCEQLTQLLDTVQMIHLQTHLDPRALEARGLRKKLSIQLGGLYKRSLLEYRSEADRK